MAFDAAGNYSLPPGSVAIPSNTILASEHNTPLDDIEAALSQVLLRSGVAPMTGDLDMGGFSIINQASGGGGGGSGGISEDNIWTGTNQWVGASNIFSTTLAGGEPLEIVSTNADAAVGPALSLYRNSASPANEDYIGSIRWYGRDSVANKQLYARMFAKITQVSSGIERGSLYWSVAQNGVLTDKMVMNYQQLLPFADGGLSLGDASHRWANVYSQGVTISGGTGLTIGGTNPFNSASYTRAMINALPYIGTMPLLGVPSGTSMIIKLSGSDWVTVSAV